jgi:SAM-dependent methyltransferase
VDGADEDGWSAVASEWAELWGSFADPARRAIIDEAGIASGTQVLDVGCGSGEFVALLAGLGAIASGADPAPRMVEHASRLVPAADIREAGAEQLPWPDDSFDVVTAINALQFADDTVDALREFARVTRPGGRIAIANWAEGALNDLNTVEEAVARAAGEELSPDGDYRLAGGLETLMREAGLEVLSAGLVECPWEAADDAMLVRGVLMGEDPEPMAQTAPIVIEAARPFRTAAVGYRLINAFRFTVAGVG